ncbi:hypothetical protein BH23CHL2_BH23CHL2_29560 [soil metagenome]
MLELAYPIDQREIAALGEIGFAERWRWREYGYSPFGVVVQIEGDGELPFSTWEYSPPFLPGLRWVIGDAGLREPLYMIVPYAEDRKLLPETPEIVSVEISCPGLAAPSPVASWLDDAGIARIISGDETAMIVGFSGSSLETLELRPEVPLALRNMTARSVTG